MHVSADALWFHFDVAIERRARPAEASGPGRLVRVIARIGAYTRSRLEPGLADLSDEALADIGLRGDELGRRWSRDPLLCDARSGLDIAFWPGLGLPDRRS